MKAIHMDAIFWRETSSTSCNFLWELIYPYIPKLELKQKTYPQTEPNNLS